MRKKGKVSVYHLFPPEKIHELPTWRFGLRFKAPRLFRGGRTKKALRALAAAELKTIRFPNGLEWAPFDTKNRTIYIAVEVPDEIRRSPDALENYESDFWKIWATMLGYGFGDVYYEAVDWNG